jgi:hypothetical protein
VNTFHFIICCRQYGNWTNSRYIKHKYITIMCWILPPPYAKRYLLYQKGVTQPSFTYKSLYHETIALKPMWKVYYWPNPSTLYSCHNTFWPVHYSGWRTGASHLHNSEVLYLLPPQQVCTKKTGPDIYFLRYAVMNFTSCLYKTLSCWQNITSTFTLITFQFFHPHIQSQSLWLLLLLMPIP